jgi:hypothetical protein
MKAEPLLTYKLHCDTCVWLDERERKARELNTGLDPVLQQRKQHHLIFHPRYTKESKEIN